MNPTASQPLSPVSADVPPFYSVSQAAVLLCMSTMTLYRAINSGGFPAVRIRGRLIVPAKAIESMIETAVAERTLVNAAEWVPQRNRGDQ